MADPIAVTMQVDADQAHRKSGAPTAWAALVASVRTALSTESLGYLYPRRGFGQLPEALAEAATAAGARIRLGLAVEHLTLERRGAAIAVSASEYHTLVRRHDHYTGGYGLGDSTAGGILHAKHVFSTLPLPLLARITTPAPAYGVLEASAALTFRALLLVYAVHDGGRWSSNDVHYLPNPDVPVTRISEPANHRINPDDPDDRSVVCFEIPCQIGDEIWSADEQHLADLLHDTVRRSHLPPLNLSWLQVKRLRHGYPVHQIGYREHLEALENWTATLPSLTVFGRQGLFTPDNVHHALTMGYQAADALGHGQFDHDKWRHARARFTTHLVES